MILTELQELVRNGENSGVEFKRDDVRPEDVAKEVVALLNIRGGHILLGVEDDGTISGLTRSSADAEQWVMNICRENVQPALIPFWETLIDGGGIIGVLTLPDDAPDKPYKARRGKAWVTFVRVGTTSREATREEEARLYQEAGVLRYDIRPVPGASITDLDERRLRSYFAEILEQEVPPDLTTTDRSDIWQRILLNTEILTEDRGRAIPTVGGLLLFGTLPNRHLPQAGISATAYMGTAKDYGVRAEEVIRGPLVSLRTRAGDIVDAGVIERAIEFVRRSMDVRGVLRGGQLTQVPTYPIEAVREGIVNAVAHRDYTIAVTDIELSMFEDRLVIVSPGTLPNTVTIEKMKQGYRAARNELLKEILRDYGYVEHRGMGVRYKLIEGMRSHNGTTPDLIEEESRFTVILRAGAPADAA